MANKIDIPADDLTELRLEQARMLKKRVVGSCLMVQFIISYTAIIIYLVSGFSTAITWVVSGTTMVLVTFFYAKLMAPDGITHDNLKSYLFGHILVSAMTGMVWSTIAIYQTDFEQEYTIFIGCLLVSSITMGGIMPSSAYRPGYVALALFAVPPFAAFLMIDAPAPFGLVGFAMLVYFAFAMYLSTRVEIDTRDGIAARQKKALTEKVIEQNKIIQKASEEKTRFLAATGHDLSQPLQSQGFFMQALRDKLQKPENIALLDQVEESWRAQKQLLQGIVDVSRIESGAITPKPVIVNLEELCQTFAAEFRSDNANNITLVTEFTQVQTVTDPVLFARIVRNILSNAKKFVPSGGQVEFRMTQQGNQAVLHIADNGPGMGEQDLQRIFDEYVQLESSNGQKTKGLGLGLSIVKRLCALLDIQMTVDSTLGVGTEFTFSVPVRADGNLPEYINRPQIQKFAQSPLVVIADDDPDILASMTHLVSSWDCQVISAPNSAAAVDRISRTSATPSLLIIDKQLGDDSGIALIQALREEVNETVPAILMSGRMGNVDKSKAGPDIEFLNKPVEPTEIWQILDRILARPKPAQLVES